MTATRNHALGIRRIVAGTLIILCLAVNALAFLYVSREHKLIEETMSKLTVEHGRFWADALAESVFEQNMDRASEILLGIAAGSDVVQASVADVEDTVIASTDTSSIGQLISASDEEDHDSGGQQRELHPEPEGFFHEEGHNFEFRFPIEKHGDHIGTLVVETNTAWGNQQAKRLALSGLGIMFLVTGAIGFAAFALDRRLRNAVQRLIAATQAIARGERKPSVRVGTRDELDLLGDSLNRMAKALLDSEEQIESWRGQLEVTVSERTKELEQSQAMLAQREKMSTLGMMAAGLAHEVGNPLAAMSTILQRIQREAEPAVQKKCETMRQQIERVSRMLREMRQFARPPSGNGSLVNANEALRLTVQVARYDPRARNIQIAADLDPRISAIPGNADRWQQVFLNIIINAFDAMPKGGALSISSRATEEYVVLSFRDTGKGLTAEEIGQLFQPFYTTKDPRDGLGLGLAISQQIVRHYGGRIEVESQPGCGSEFRIIVPRVHKNRKRTEISPQAQKARRAQGSKIHRDRSHLGERKLSP